MYGFEIDKLPPVKCFDLCKWNGNGLLELGDDDDCHRIRVSMSDVHFHFCVLRESARFVFSFFFCMLHVKWFKTKGEWNFINCIVEIYKLLELIVFSFIYCHLSTPASLLYLADSFDVWVVRVFIHFRKYYLMKEFFYSVNRPSGYYSEKAYQQMCVCCCCH